MFHSKMTNVNLPHAASISAHKQETLVCSNILAPKYPGVNKTHGKSSSGLHTDRGNVLLPVSPVQPRGLYLFPYFQPQDRREKEIHIREMAPSDQMESDGLLIRFLLSAHNYHKRGVWINVMCVCVCMYCPRCEDINVLAQLIWDSK